MDGTMKTSTIANNEYDQEGRARIAEPHRGLPIPPEKLRDLQPEFVGLTSRADRFLSGRTVSAMTGDASKRKIRHWVDRGEFNSYALDGKTVYSEQQILDFLERIKARGPSRAPWRGNRGAASGKRPSNAPKQ